MAHKKAGGSSRRGRRAMFGVEDAGRWSLLDTFQNKLAADENQDRKSFRQWDVLDEEQLERLVACGYPVLVGLSRKSLIGQILGLPVDNRLQAGVALATLAVWKGAAIVRCHDVRETREAILMCQAVRDVVGPARS